MSFGKKMAAAAAAAAAVAKGQKNTEWNWTQADCSLFPHFM